MQAAAIWQDNQVRRIIVNHNFPFVIWVFAVLMHLCGIDFFGGCIVVNILGLCFGCGLTREFSLLMSGELAHGTFIYLILAGFILNFVYSLRIAHAALQQRL